jgi:hypothetical protein
MIIPNDKENRTMPHISTIIDFTPTKHNEFDPRTVNEWSAAKCRRFYDQALAAWNKRPNVYTAHGLEIAELVLASYNISL